MIYIEYNYLNFIKIYYDLLKHINFFYISHYSILKNVILHFTALFDTKSQKEKSVQLYYVRINILLIIMYNFFYLHTNFKR